MTNERRMTARQLADKVHWEGGILSALEYGISSEEIEDPEIASLWQRMEDLYGQLRPSIEVADRMLKSIRRNRASTSEAAPAA